MRGRQRERRGGQQRVNTLAHVLLQFLFGVLCGPSMACTLLSVCKPNNNSKSNKNSNSNNNSPGYMQREREGGGKRGICALASAVKMIL